uniref:Uncharacterized protein n=1 Tax=Chromera velia CCMP2878 TaxID=1169474 RepID=A0A0G4FN65_9ALVE|eukprot:Cvel_17798.t1-p1 / transcript=Cvel_17798.t1 / gene=Cvel_17798 / organism=Chromera_velia_CCMP2878 / gene_product=hypothetical protein / transcript_product=hypothetical protein / location=Cvel_scaffold1441:21709-27609(+) / protein_length=1066 / sequence_SO=supercontig / SO=protein_coding / is_pseudo=false
MFVSDESSNPFAVVGSDWPPPCVLLTKTAAPRVYQLSLTLEVSSLPFASLSARLLPYDQEVPLCRRENELGTYLTGSVFIRAPESGTVVLQEVLKTSAQTFTRQTVVHLQTKALCRNDLSTCPTVRGAPPVGTEPTGSSSFSSGPRADHKQEDVAAEGSPAAPLRSAPAEGSFAKSGAGELFFPDHESLGSVSEGDRESNLDEWEGDPHRDAEQTKGRDSKERNSLMPSDPSALCGVSLFSFPRRHTAPQAAVKQKEEPPDGQGLPASVPSQRQADPPQANSRRASVDSRLYWSRCLLERFHIRLVFDHTPETTRFLTRLTSKEGRGELQAISMGLRQLITDVIDYRGDVSPSSDRAWTIGTDPVSSVRAASVRVCLSPDGQLEAMLMIGLHLRRLDRKKRPTVEELEFWVDREFMQKVLREWDKAPCQLSELVRRCRGLEARRATDVLKFGLKVEIDTKRAFERLGWAVPEDPKRHLQYLSRLWGEARFYSCLLLGARKAEFPFLHSGALCVGRFRDRSFDPHRFVSLKQADVTEINLPIHVLPGVEALGDEEAVREETLRVFECLNEGFARFLSRQRKYVGATQAVSGPNQLTSCSDESLKEAVQSEGSAADRGGVLKSPHAGAPQAAGGPLRWRALADSNCIRSSLVRGPPDSWKLPTVFLNVLFDLGLHAEQQDQDTTPDERMRAENPASEHAAVLLREFEKFVKRAAESRGLTAAPPRGVGEKVKEKPYREIPSDPTTWTFTFEFMMRLVGENSVQTEVEGKSNSSSEKVPPDSSGRSFFLMQWKLYLNGRKAVRWSDSLLETSARDLVDELLSVATCHRVVNPPTHPKASLSLSGSSNTPDEAKASSPVSGGQRKRLREQETVWNQRLKNVRGVWVGSFEKPTWESCLPEATESLITPSTVSLASAYSGTPFSSMTLSGTVPPASLPLDTVESPFSASSALQGHADLREGFRRLNGRIGIEFRDGKTYPGDVSRQAKKIKGGEETEKGVQENAKASSSWLRKRLLQDGKAFFLPASQTNSVNNSVLGSGSQPKGRNEEEQGKRDIKTLIVVKQESRQEKS